MTSLAQFVGVCVAALGLCGIVAPGGLLALGAYVGTIAGLFAVAVIRVSVGIILVGASRASRAPRTLLVLGVLIIVGGLVTPLFGVERTQAVLAWDVRQGVTAIRLVAVILVVAGASLGYVVSGRSGAKPHG